MTSSLKRLLKWSVFETLRGQQIRANGGKAVGAEEGWGYEDGLEKGGGGWKIKLTFSMWLIGELSRCLDF